MPDEHEDAVSEYTADSRSTSAPSAPEQPPTDVKVEAERYGEAKPRRVVLRAKITHDKN